jgi:hypothetical protein
MSWAVFIVKDFDGSAEQVGERTFEDRDSADERMTSLIERFGDYFADCAASAHYEVREVDS